MVLWQKLKKEEALLSGVVTGKSSEWYLETYRMTSDVLPVGNHFRHKEECMQRPGVEEDISCLGPRKKNQVAGI